MDEIWGFVGKKQRNIKYGDHRLTHGDVWTFASIDPDSKLVINHEVGKRTAYHTNVFLEDLARPKTPKAIAKVPGISVRLSRDEKGQIDSAIKKSKLSQSDWARKSLIYVASSGIDLNGRSEA